MLLDPEVRFAGRVLGPLGRPVPDATVEVLGGCSHGTAAARGVTDEDGRFSIDGVDRGLAGQTWIEGPGIEAALDALGVQRSIGNAGVVLAMDPGARYTGRVVDLLGAPVEGVVVRAFNAERGPATRTDGAGRYVLEGADSYDGLVLFPPAALTDTWGPWLLDDALPGLDATIVISPLGVVREEETARIRVRAEDEKGRPVCAVGYRLARLDTGRGESGWIPEEPNDDAPAGDAVEMVAPGRWRVLPEEPFGAHTFDPTAVDVCAGETGSVTLLPRPQSRLQLDGALPAKAELTVLLEGDASSPIDEEGAWLPAEVVAAVRVLVKGRPPFFFPVGPDEKGVRQARVVLPEPRRILLPEGARNAALFDGPWDAYAYASDEAPVLLTDASGPLRILWDAPDGTRREAEVAVPEKEGASVVVNAADSRVVHETTRVRALDEDGTVLNERTEAPGEWVVFERQGWRKLHGRAPTARTLDVAWGSCALSVSVRDEDGPVDALVLVGDQVHAARGGLLELRGLDAGPLHVVVGRRDVVGEGRAFSVDLEAGETRVLDIELPIE